MLVNAFDGSNALLGIDAVHLKALSALLQQVTLAQCVGAAERLKMDGFNYLAPEIETLAQQFVLGTRRITNAVRKLPSNEEGDPVIDETIN